MLKKTLIILFVLSIGFIGCNKDTETPFQPTVSTESFTFTSDGSPVDLSSTTTADYTVGTTKSKVAASSGGDSMAIDFNGNSAGGPWTQANGVVIGYLDGGEAFSSGAPGGSCTLTVTSYGAVGEKIVGTFSGTLVSGAMNTRTITSGQFSVTRSADK